MKVSESDVSLFSSHHKKHEVNERESLEKWDRPQDAPERLQVTDRLELTEKFQHMHKGKKVSELENELNENSLDPKLMSIIRALEALTGRKIDVSFFKNVQATDLEAQKMDEEPQEIQRVGWGINYQYEKHEIKEESLNFSASGNVKTEDGKSIDFSLAFNMKSHSELHESISFKAGDALIDPLVLNFDSNVVTISDVKHEFDLDLDGKSEEFSFVGNGSGFLAIDKNNDGIINDGSELFGPNSGNGFNDLRAYDSDGNNWIDENDEVYEQLLIWTKDASGEENLYSLKDKNVGALYIESSKTSFELNEAQLKESSVYLKEDGGVGTLQEVDLVI
ncbi:hypothetical protein [Sulfurimonas sp.]